MEKGLLKKVLGTAGMIVLLLGVGIAGVIWSQNSGKEVLKQYGNTIYPGVDFLDFALPVLYTVAGIALIFQEFKLLGELFAKGGKKVRTGCILALVIPIVLVVGAFGIALYSVLTTPSNKPSVSPDVQQVTTTMNTYFDAVQKNDYNGMNSLLQPGALQGTDAATIALLRSWCKAPVYLSVDEQSLTTGPDPFVDVTVLCQGDKVARIYSLMRNGSGPVYTWTILSVRK